MVNPFEVGYYTEADLKDAGFKSLGNNIRIARDCTIMGLSNISIGNNVIIDAQSIILPNVTIGRGSLVGALSLVSTNLASWGVFCGYPLRRLKSRSKHLLKLKKLFLQEYSQKNGYIEHLNGHSQ